MRADEQLVLSLFPGLGMLDMAFEQAGFHVVQDRDWIFGGDVRTKHFLPGRFDGIIGGPPCQAFSSLAHMVRHNGHEPKFGNLIPEFERAVREAAPQWFLMEEVPAAPIPAAEGYSVHSFVLNNRQLGEDQSRNRRISFGWRGEHKILEIDTVMWHSRHFEYAACGGTHGVGGIATELAGNTPAALRARARKAGSGKPKTALRNEQRLNSAVGFNIKSKSSLARLVRLQGLPENFVDAMPFTVAAACKMVGNGVPMAMGRALAKAVAEITEAE